MEGAILRDAPFADNKCFKMNAAIATLVSIRERWKRNIHIFIKMVSQMRCEKSMKSISVLICSSGMAYGQGYGSAGNTISGRSGQITGGRNVAPMILMLQRA